MQVTWAAESETYIATVAAFSSNQALYPFKIVYDEFGDESWGAFSRDKFITVDGCHAFEFVGQPPSPVVPLQACPGQPAGSSPQPAPGAAAPSQRVEGYQGPPSAPANAMDCATSAQTPARSPQGPQPGSRGPQAAQTSTEAPKKRKRDEEGDELGSASDSQERPEVQAASRKDLLGTLPACTYLNGSSECCMHCMGFRCAAASQEVQAGSPKDLPGKWSTLPMLPTGGSSASVTHRTCSWQLG